MPSSAIKRENNSIELIIWQVEFGKRGPFLILTPAQRFSENHWSNGNTIKDYIHSQNNISYHTTKKQAELKLSPDYPALTTWGAVWLATSYLLQTLDDNNITILLIPPNCTNRLWPLEISVNKAAKEFVTRFGKTDHLCTLWFWEMSIWKIQ